MILVKIQSGLGNQLFQYALGKHLSIVNQTLLKLDTISYFEHTGDEVKRKIGLEYFNIKADIASTEEIFRIKYGNRMQRWGICQKNYYIKQLGFGDSISNYQVRKNYIVNSSFLAYDKNILRIFNRHVYLDGFWQALQYVEPIRDMLLEDLSFKEPPQSINQSLMQQMKTCDSIAIHVRRTDYITTIYGANHYILLDVNYYKQAIEILENKMNKLTFFVFSDDIAWCKNNLNISKPVVYVEHNTSEPHEDLRLISACKHQIIANSTYSWWGAWLNQNPDKVVIAPAKWFHTPDASADDLLPRQWIRI